ncbi:MAG: M56 family metallopeptidase [Flavobacteriales bacterium]
MIAYIFKSGAIAFICLGVYHILLKREKMLVFNRLFLLVGLLAALVIPLMELSVSSGMSAVSNGLAQLEYVFLGEPAISVIVSESIDWGSVITAVYGLVTAFLLLRFAFQLFSLVRKAKTNNRSILNGVILVQTSEKVPFAFWNYVFVPYSKNLEESVSSEVMAHESAHVRQLHSADVLFIELIRLVFWFNPVFFFYKKVIQMNHEFLADSAVVENSKNIVEYQETLLNSLSPSHNEFLTSSFNYNVTKHRLKMMNKHTTNRKKTVIALSCAPLFMLMALLFSGQSIAQDAQSEQTRSSINNMYFKDAVFLFQNKEGQDIYTDYANLSEKRKHMLPPPPPLPEGEKLKPLPPETLVVLKKDGKVQIQNPGSVKIPPPPPPAPPAPKK